MIHPGQEGGDSRIVTARGSGCGGRGRRCATREMRSGLFGLIGESRERVAARD